MKKIILSLCFCMLLIPSAFAVTGEAWLPWTPVQASIISPIALPPMTDNVYGARGNLIYGWNKRVVGFDAGMIQNSERTTGVQMGMLANISGTMEGIAMPFSVFPCVNVSRDFAGLQLSYICNYSDDITGLQVFPIFNVAKNVSGMQMALLVNNAHNVCFWQSAFLANISENLSGYQGGFSNTVSNEMSGWQSAIFINNAKKMSGLQTSSFMNRAKDLNGIQFGAINYTEEINGLQIGLLNINKNRILPFINF
jgi:hypothetical protein